MTATLAIAIIRTTSLGDVILATAVLDFLGALPLETKVTWFGRPPTLGVLKASYPDITTQQLDSTTSWWQLYQQLGRHDVVIDLQQSVKTRAVCLALQAFSSTIVCFSDKLYRQRHELLQQAKTRGRDGRLSNEALEPPRRQFEVAVSTCHDAIVTLLSCSGSRSGSRLGADVLDEELKQVLAQAKAKARPKLSFSSEQINATTAKIQSLVDGQGEGEREQDDMRWLAVAPGASYATKRAPIATFASLINEAFAMASAAQDQRFGVLLLGDDKDSEACAQLKQQLSVADSPVYDLSGKLTFVESVITVGLCEVMLGNDSVLPHCSEAQGKPCFSFFGPTIEGFGFAPFLAKSRSLSVDLGCRPCSKHGQNPCRFEDLACFHQLPISKVAQQLAQTLL